MPLTATELNRLADDIVSADGQFYVHTGPPGVDGTSNRVGVSPPDALAATWSEAANGDVVYGAAVRFGILSLTSETTPLFWSYVRGGTVRATGAINDGQAVPGNVTVPPDASFALASGTIRINGSTD